MKLTLQMIDNDGYGGNLSGEYDYFNESLIESKVNEYLGLWENNTADLRQLIHEYRRSKLGLWKAWKMSLLESLVMLGDKSQDKLDSLQGHSEDDDVPFWIQ